MKKFGKILLILIVAFAGIVSISCSFEKKALKRGYIKPDSITKVDSIFVIDSTSYDTLIITGDSMLLTAYFKCDSLGNVYMADIAQYKGELFELQQKFNNGQFSVKVVYKDRLVLVPKVFRSVKQKTSATVYVSVKYIPILVKILAWIGGILIIFYVGKIIWRIYIKRYLDKNGGQLLR